MAVLQVLSVSSRAGFVAKGTYKGAQAADSFSSVPDP